LGSAARHSSPDNQLKEILKKQTASAPQAEAVTEIAQNTQPNYDGETTAPKWVFTLLEAGICFWWRYAHVQRSPQKF
jgi:hypothetical protein